MKFPQKDVDSLLAAVDNAGKTPAKHAGDELASLSIFDHSFYKRILELDGEDKAVELHKRAWLKRVNDSMNEGKGELGFINIDSIHSLGMTAKAAFERRGCIVEVNEIRPDYFEAEIIRDPLFEHAISLNGESVGSPFMNSFAEVLEESLAEMAAQCEAEKPVESKLVSSLFAGDDTSKFIFTWKEGC